MEVTLRIPDEVAKRLSADGSDVSRRALEGPGTSGVSRSDSDSVSSFGNTRPFARRNWRFLGPPPCPALSYRRRLSGPRGDLFEAASLRR